MPSTHLGRGELEVLLAGTDTQAAHLEMFGPAMATKLYALRVQLVKEAARNLAMLMLTPA